MSFGTVLVHNTVLVLIISCHRGVMKNQYWVCSC
ncbi:hypothetical protein T08_15385 [Trichinella sp. T8]|nr:hypothetical protein T08_15385 [Trichinella sp. T8]